MRERTDAGPSTFLHHILSYSFQLTDFFEFCFERITMAPPTGPKDTSKPSSGRKRQRPKESKTAKLKEYGLDLPDIR
jgi:hypothetical protein